MKNISGSYSLGVTTLLNFLNKKIMEKTPISLLIILVYQLAIGQSISKQVMGAAGKTQTNSTNKIS